MLGLPALTRIQSGFFSTSPAGTTLIGMREVLACDFCFAVASYAGLSTVLMVRIIALHPVATPPRKTCDRRRAGNVRSESPMSTSKFIAAPMLGAALLAACGLVGASSHREAPFITTVPKVDATDFYMFRSYEPGREDYVTVIANYQPLQDAYGGPNYFKMDPNALYEIHVDNNGDAKEDISFQFRFQNTLANNGAGVTLPIGGKMVAIPLTQAGQVANVADGNLNVGESFTLNVMRGDRRKGTGAAATAASGGGTRFDKPADNIGTKTIPDYAGYAAKHVLQREHAGLHDAGQGVRRPAPGPVRREPGHDLRPRERTAVRDHRPGADRRRAQHHRRQERHDARAGSAQELPDRRRRARDRRLDHRQPAPGAAARRHAAGRPADRPRRSAAPGCRCRAWACRWSTRS